MPSKTDDTLFSEQQHDVSTTKQDKINERKDSKGLDKCDATDCTQHWENAEHMKQNQAEYKKFQEDNRAEQAASTTSDDDIQDQSQNTDDNTNNGLKRGRGANATLSANKKRKSSPSSEPNGTAGDKNRVPTEGQKVQWKGHPGSVDGVVVEVVYEEKEVEGQKVEGSKEDPRIVVKRDETGEGEGEISVLEPQDVYFD